MFALLLAGHLVADFIVQTDYQALNKTWPQPWAEHADWELRYFAYASAKRRSWVTNQQHCLTYHLTMAAFVLPFYRSWALLWALVVSWGTHALIDRRWPVRRLLEATRSPEFAKTSWGPLAADQALHIAILAVIAALLPSYRARPLDSDSYLI